MGTREGAVARAVAFFDGGGFRELLAELVAIPSTSQEAAHADDVTRYLESAILPWLERLGFACAIEANPEAGFGPILSAERIEGAELPTVLTYGHGDTVRGLDEQWREGLAPWRLTIEGDRWYGRGSADNKGQHALNLAALEAVLAERGGKLGCNLKLVLETSEERGSLGLRAFVARHKAALAADVLIGSDGPRVSPEMPTIAVGTRGTFHFDLAVRLRAGGVHSGHWGGLTKDPAIVLAHAIGAIADRHGRIMVREWLPKGGVPESVARVLEGCPVGSGAGGGAEAATIDPDWGEPGLTPAEKIFGWNSFIVLAMISGRPENPVNAVAPDARAHCQYPLHGGHRARDFRPRAQAASRSGGLFRGRDRERAHPHAGEPHRSCRSVGSVHGGEHGTHAREEGAGDPERGRRAAGGRVRGFAERRPRLGAAQLQRLRAARAGRASAGPLGARRHRRDGRNFLGYSARRERPRARAGATAGGRRTGRSGAEGGESEARERRPA